MPLDEPLKLNLRLSYVVIRFSCYSIHERGVPFSLILLDRQVKFTMAGSPFALGKPLSSVPALGKCILETRTTQLHMPWYSITTAGFKFQKGQLSTEKNLLGHTCFAGAPMWLYPAFVVLQPGILTVIFAKVM